MAHVTVARLVQLAPRIPMSTAQAIVPILDEEMPRFGVNSVLRRGHFLGQVCHESGDFTRFEENLRYTSPARIAAVWPRLAKRAAALAGSPQALANAAYSGRLGNGPEASGDGWRYRGRGLIQLTGRENYLLAGRGLGLDLVGDPDQVAQPRGAVLTALWFWKRRNCNDAADMDDAEAITSIINGPARLGLSHRRELAERAQRIFT